MGKKLLVWLMALGMCLSLCACGGSSDNSSATENSSATTSESTSDSTSDSESTSDSTSDSASDSASDSESNDDTTSDSADDSTSEDSGEEDKKEYVTVTFIQSGEEAVVKTVEKGTALTDVPAPAVKTGYTVCWDITDFSNITENLTVNAVETAKTYTVIYRAEDADLAQTTSTVTYGQKYELLVPNHADNVFLGWMYNGEIISMEGVWNIDAESGQVILVAKWISGWTGNY